MSSSRHQEYLDDLPVDWEKVPIDSLGTIYSGGTPRRDQPSFWNGTIAWVTPGELTSLNNKYLTKTREFISELGLTSSSAQMLPSGSLLVTTRATIGLVVISKIPVCTNQGFKNIVPNKLTNSNFYYYLLKYIVSEMSRLAMGSTFDEISRRDFSTIIVPRPEFQEQQKIAEILDTVDKAIALTQTHISKLKLAKAGLLHDLLTSGIDEHGELRNPTRNPEQFKDSPLGRIPKDWDIQLVADVFDMQLGKMLSKASKKGYSPYAYLANRHIQWERIDITNLEWMDFNIQERDKFALLPGDLLVCEGGESGRTAIWKGELENCYYQKAIHRLRPKSSRIFPEYMLRFMRWAYNYGLLTELTSKTSITHLTEEKLAILPISLPDREEQQRIIQIFETNEERIVSKQKRLEKLKLLKKGLVSDLLTGKVRVKI